jgi:hypothetical protein
MVLWRPSASGAAMARWIWQAARKSRLFTPLALSFSLASRNPAEIEQLQAPFPFSASWYQ